MKTILLTTAVLLLMSFSCLGQIDLKEIQTKVKNGGYGKIFGDKLIFMGIENSVDSINIYYKNIEKSCTEKVLVEQTYSRPIGWFDDHTILLLKKNPDFNYIYLYDINTNNVLGEIRDNSVRFSENNLDLDEDILVYFPYYFEDTELKSYKYDISTGKKTLIKELVGIELERISYNKKNDVLAFTWYDRETKISYLSILNSGHLTNITKFKQYNSSDESPLILSDDGENLYYVYTENHISKLNKYELDSGEVTELYQFNKEVSCLDLSYSNKKLLITLDGIKPRNELKVKSKDLKYDYEVDLEIGISMYLIENI